MGDSSTITTLFYILVGLGLINFFRKNDEFLAVVFLFFYSSCLNRFDKIMDGTVEYVYVAYARNIFEMNDTLAYQALVYMFVGTLCLTISYLVFSMQKNSKAQSRDTNKHLKQFLKANQTFILVGFFVVFVLSVILTGSALAAASSGESLAYGQSYFYYFGFALSGMILLMFLAFRNMDKSRDMFMRTLFLVLIVIGALYTYDINNRFKMLAWVVGVGIVLTQKYKPIRKLLIFGVGGYVTVLLFSFLGVIRMGKLNFNSDLNDIYTASVERINSAEDQNMLDGMMMIMQVYPAYLPHAWGMEHIEILLRPIPRSIWAGKPLGSYINKLGLNDNMEGATVGISPSLYGSFYAEAGLFGIILISTIYGFYYVKVFRYAATYGSDLQYVIKGMAISGTIPLLRGGDLPGIVAFICMAYWPVFLFIYKYNGWLRKMKRLEAVDANQEVVFDNLLKLQQQLKPESIS